MHLSAACMPIIPMAKAVLDPVQHARCHLATYCFKRGTFSFLACLPLHEINDEASNWADKQARGETRGSGGYGIYTRRQRQGRKKKGRGTGDGRESKDSKRVHGCMGKTSRTHAHTQVMDGALRSVFRCWNGHAGVRHGSNSRRFAFSFEVLFLFRALKKKGAERKDENKGQASLEVLFRLALAVRPLHSECLASNVRMGERGQKNKSETLS